MLTLLSFTLTDAAIMRAAISHNPKSVMPTFHLHNLLYSCCCSFQTLVAECLNVIFHTCEWSMRGDPKITGTDLLRMRAF
jgi:hypothetical protein